MERTKPIISNLFQVQLRDTQLTPEQAQRVATAIREAAAEELLKMDFRIDELKRSIFDPTNVLNCGGACSQCSG